MFTSNSKLDIEFYLQKVKEAGHIPNFWCSVPYILAAGWNYWTEGACFGICDSDGKYTLPTFNSRLGMFINSNCWAGFPLMTGKKFLDYQYMYDPRSFMDLSGGKWKTFRKNLHKWEKDPTIPKTLPGGIANLFIWETSLGKDIDERWLKWGGSQAQNLLISWAERHGDIYDNEVLINFMINDFGQNLICLGTAECKLLGVIAYDYSVDSEYANFRYSICEDLPGLDEYMRYCFYRIMYNKNCFKINDGGCLGSETLEAFKERLNPIARYSIYSNH